MNGTWFKYFWKAHLANPLWKDSLTRRVTRQLAWADYKLSLFNKYIPFIKNLKIDDKVIKESSESGDDRVFTLWNQGYRDAPLIVKKCLDNLKTRFGDKLTILDKDTVLKYIDLPEYILRKYKEKKIGQAHFSDICRIELLYKFGGYWFDATDFVTGEIPDFIKDSDFFMYISGDSFFVHMFVQNCFIRAKKGDILLALWRELVLEYWKTEDEALDYFTVQMLFRLLVTHNKIARKEFDKMTKIPMDCTHVLWHESGNQPFNQVKFEEMCRNAFFQKCSYKPQKKKRGVNEIIPGSMADYLINGEKKFHG